MDGIINILKPPGMTSFDVIAVLRGLTGVRRIGHAGTLDPMAAGVLPVCIGRATKAIEFLMDKDKEYRAELTLGITTDTQDTTGSVILRTLPVSSDEQIAEAVSSFVGTYQQKPPMHSAVRVDGKRLYELAREGIEVERQQREVKIYSASVLGIDRSDGIKALIDIHCSKGTYIRTLCADIGERLGCGGCMSFLLRKRAGPFGLSDAFTLEELSDRKKNDGLNNLLTSVDRIFGTLAAYRLDGASERKFCNGMQVPILKEHLFGAEANSDEKVNGMPQSNFKLSGADENSTYVRVYGSKGDFIALGLIIENDNGTYLRVKKFF